VHDNAGVQLGAVLTLRDDTARAASEAALRELNATLEQRVAAEVAALAETEEQLRQAQKMEAVGQLTGGIAHDFNNLLAGIVGSLDLLQRRVEQGRTEGLERYTSTAMTSAQRAAALTQRLLAFARRQPLDPKPVEPNRLLAGMEDLLRRTLGPNIELEMVLAGGLWPTLSDPNQLESAILNLAINALLTLTSSYLSIYLNNIIL
jgi:signal transduction histidine kinase